MELVDPETRRQMEADPMFRVEKTTRAQLGRCIELLSGKFAGTVHSGDMQKERNDKARLSDLQDRSRKHGERDDPPV